MHGIEIIQRPQVVVTVFIKLLFSFTKLSLIFQLLVITMFGPVLLISISTEENKELTKFKISQIFTLFYSSVQSNR